MSLIQINDKVSIGEDELVFKFTRSGGPGGQNVNKVNTRVTLFFDVEECESLSDSQKKRIYKKLSTRVNKKGVLRVACQKHRTQKANRQGAVERFVELLREALKRKPVRKKTKVPRRAVERRLAEKKRRSEIKQQRTKRDFDN